jgi:hypothetical protein
LQDPRDREPPRRSAANSTFNEPLPRRPGGGSSAPRSNPFGAARPVATRDTADLAPVRLGRGPRDAPAGGRGPAPAARPESRYLPADDNEDGADDSETAAKADAAGEDAAARDGGAEGEDDDEEAVERRRAAKAAAEAKAARVDSKVSAQKVVSAKDRTTALDIALRDEKTADVKTLTAGYVERWHSAWTDGGPTDDWTTD